MYKTQWSNSICSLPHIPTPSQVSLQNEITYTNGLPGREGLGEGQVDLEACGLAKTQGVGDGRFSTSQ
jgi:hypothetical protein